MTTTDRPTVVNQKVSPNIDIKMLDSGDTGFDKEIEYESNVSQ